LGIFLGLALIQCALFGGGLVAPSASVVDDPRFGRKGRPFHND
jgi:hypothetical protein